MKKLLIYLRTSVKLVSLVIISAICIVAAVTFIYKPIYSVTINGEFVGYTQDKSKLQTKINEYVKKGEGQNIAFVQIDNLPEYQLCLLKKGIVTNDDEIYEKVTQAGIPYYKYYAIVENGEEKTYVASFEEAEGVVKSLKDKNSSNKDNVGIVEKYETELTTLVTSEEAISKLYSAPVQTVTVAKTTQKASTAQVKKATANTSGTVVNLGMNLIKPVSGTISSRYGTRWGSTHKGLDIAAPYGTAVKAAAAGTVTQAGWNSGGYGYLVVISHGNGVETYYGHCSSIDVKKGQQVSQGQVISRVGSTGNSTGNHLHFEIRVKGVAQNPQNYVY